MTPEYFDGKVTSIDQCLGAVTLSYANAMQGIFSLNAATEQKYSRGKKPELSHD